MPKIILFNGPPRSGKDTATGMALEYLGKRAVHYRFAAPLKDAIHGLFGMGGVKHEHFDMVKNDPSDIFFGMTPRNAYIWLSEEVAKPKFGSDFFARVAVNAIRNLSEDRTIVISDCGFNEEVEALRKEFGSENILVIYLEREGTDFSKDSRSYISAPLCKTCSIVNNGSYSQLNEKVIRCIEPFVNAK